VCSHAFLLVNGILLSRTFRIDNPVSFIRSLKMKSGSTSHRHTGVNFLASFHTGGLVLHSSVGQANNCTDTDCASAEAAIWTGQSKAFEDNAMPIPGWHPFPDTSYQVVTLPPDGSGSTTAYVTTDNKSDFPGDFELTRQEKNRLSARLPHVVQTDPTLNGVYGLRVHLDQWAGSLDEAAIASTRPLQKQA
jgi:hypothetical protein